MPLPWVSVVLGLSPELHAYWGSIVRMSYRPNLPLNFFRCVLLYVCESCACIYVCAPEACLGSAEFRRKFQLSGIGVIGGYEPPRGFGKLNLSPLKEESVLNY